MEEKNENFPSLSFSENMAIMTALIWRLRKDSVRTSTRFNEAKFEDEIHISYQILKSFIVILILWQARLNQTDAETICWNNFFINLLAAEKSSKSLFKVMFWKILLAFIRPTFLIQILIWYFGALVFIKTFSDLSVFGKNE